MIHDLGNLNQGKGVSLLFKGLNGGGPTGIGTEGKSLIDVLSTVREGCDGQQVIGDIHFLEGGVKHELTSDTHHAHHCEPYWYFQKLASWDYYRFIRAILILQILQ